MGAIPPDWAIPEIDATNEKWFTSQALMVQVCSRCSARQHPPEEVCHRCGAMEFGHVTLAPHGTVHSYTIVHHPANPALAESVPYAVVLVSLDEDPHVRIVGNMPGIDPADIRIGMPVTSYWEQRTAPDGTHVRLPQWAPTQQ